MEIEKRLSKSIELKRRFLIRDIYFASSCIAYDYALPKLKDNNQIILNRFSSTQNRSSF